jgi:diaminohydroxyphosphoribosylaminopyrimidine deaminase/5-amino-6-(5-phosphoribosylamino)uracil reductase
VEVHQIDRSGSRLDPAAVLAFLGTRGVHSVLVEGGAQLAQSLLAADLVERWYLFMAPRIIGPDALRAFETWPAVRPSQWQHSGHRLHGPDLEVVLERDRSGA